MRHTFKSLQKAFKNSTSGSVAIMASVALPIAIFSVGMAVDLARFLEAKETVQRSLDSAVLYAASELGRTGPNSGSVQAITESSQNYMRVNLMNNPAVDAEAVIRSLRLTASEQDQSVRADVGVVMPTLFTTLFGIEQLDASLQSSADFPSRTEIVFVLDNTGSMTNPISRNNGDIDVDIDDENLNGRPLTRLESLQTALRTSINTLLPSGGGNDNFVRVGMVPYSDSVNLGRFHEAAVGRNTPSASEPSRCVSEREGRVGFRDVAPRQGMRRTYYETDRFLRGLGQAACPAVAVRPLTNNRNALLRDVGRFTGDGFTAGHNGITWGFNMLSENYQDFWPQNSRPADYNDRRTRKILVIMTDGEFNTSYLDRDKGTERRIARRQVAASNLHAEAQCANAEEEQRNIRVFTIAFGTGDADDVLRSCASFQEDFFIAQDDEALQNAFGRIVDQVLQPTLTQ